MSIGVIVVVTCFIIALVSFLLLGRHTLSRKSDSQDVALSTSWGFPALERICHSLENTPTEWTIDGELSCVNPYHTLYIKSPRALKIRVYDWDCTTTRVGRCVLMYDDTLISLSSHDDNRLRKAVRSLKVHRLDQEQKYAKARIEEELNESNRCTD